MGLGVRWGSKYDRKHRDTASVREREARSRRGAEAQTEGEGELVPDAVGDKLGAGEGTPPHARCGTGDSLVSVRQDPGEAFNLLILQMHHPIEHKCLIKTQNKEG